MTTTRRTLLGAPLAALPLAACDRLSTAAAAPSAVPPLKSIAPFPVGTCAMTGQFDDPAWLELLTTHFSQITPEWEMKMEYVLQPDGSFRWDAPDALARRARDLDLRLYCTTLIWYAQDHPWLKSLPPSRFAAAFDRWISTVAGRYRGQAVGWDVVNEPVAEDGDGLRDCLYSQRLGQDGYIIRAFEQARQADPDAVLFLNDYNLENLPRKGATYLRLVERLLEAGAPITGLGTQSHLDIEIPSGQIRDIMRELGQFGLPVHVSELDASRHREAAGPDLRSPRQKVDQQIARVSELAEAFMALPERQRFAFTVWGVRDTDNWQVRPDGRGWTDASPLLFDGEGRPNPMFQALSNAFQGRGRR